MIVLRSNKSIINRDIRSKMMKIYISADIEGIAGISHWDEATRWKPDYPPFNEELMNEIKAACEGANQAGAKEI
jgi:D-amino peptidase